MHTARSAQKRLIHQGSSTSVRCALFAIALSFAGCGGGPSALNPAGHEAESIADLFWVMTVGAFLIWAAMLCLTYYAVRSPSESFSRRRARLMIVGGGAVVPTIVLSVLLIGGLSMLARLVTRAPQGSRIVSVAGEMWWWRVRYETPGGEPIVLANEIHLPIGEPVQFQLESDNVIHSFWVPALGGKMDMIPGRMTRLALTPLRTGVFGGVCAEFCGTSHALMKFDVVVEEQEQFNRWLAHQARPAELPTDAVASRGQEVFLANGCHSCHTVRGTAAAGVVGPDLTHVGSRLSIAAGTLPADPAGFQRWIAGTDEVKPEAKMPRFDMLSEKDLRALAVYMEGLQ